MTKYFAGKRVLIVEDEPLIADHLAYQLTAEGAEVIGPVASVDAALHLIANTRLDGATLDIKLMGNKTFEVADVLADHGIPFLFLTGYDAGTVPPRHANVSRVEKPVTPGVVSRALKATLVARSIHPVT